MPQSPTEPANQKEGNMSQEGEKQNKKTRQKATQMNKYNPGKKGNLYIVMT